MRFITYIKKETIVSVGNGCSKIVDCQKSLLNDWSLEIDGIDYGKLCKPR